MNLDTFDRRRAGLLDIVIMQFGLVAPLGLMSIISTNEIFTTIINWLYFLTIILFISKDIFKGNSLSKISHGIQVVDFKTEGSASKLQTVFRNSTLLLLFPLELIIGFISPKRRIGDYIAGTKLKSIEKRSALNRIKTFQFSEIDKQSLITIIVAFGITVISMLIIEQLFKLI